ncbi:sensor histidine kinase [Niallia taxi]|uniref:sensor histidine kinase n=2 Tax=Niallia taxi TaxID=2499688 RepID=UPI00203D3C6C|nr:sensor histidine kinase [Niallia taxi]MCM3213064.1 sensor histidine kinase [Niallia taxi]MDK8641946.1 sensor histidine kinase [Niallia taxi]
MDNTTFNDRLEGIGLSKIAYMVWIVLVYVAAIAIQVYENATVHDIVLLTLFSAIHFFLYYLSVSLQLSKKQSWFYIMLQISLLFLSSFFLHTRIPILLVGILPMLIAQSITIFNSWKKVLIAFIAIYAVYCNAIWLNYGSSELPIFILVFFFNLTLVVFYSVMYNRQVNARIRMAYYLKDLERVHKRVEELTLANERQRMARDLHDTLAQGLAGIIMQLEAVDSHLHNGNTERAHEIIQHSMSQARETLRKSRTVIDDLRSVPVEKNSFNKQVLEQLEVFKQETRINVELLEEPIVNIPYLVRENCLYIISECLANIKKHANAEKVRMEMKIINSEIVIKISDNGIGFKKKSIGNHAGRYGLIGLFERARLIGGEIQINSDIGIGTEITMKVPIKGEAYGSV